jgi:hypothetical protein
MDRASHSFTVTVVGLEAGISPSHAKQIVKVAQQRASYPLIIDAFDRGQLTFDQVPVVVTRAPTWADERVLHFTHNATVTQLRRAIRAERFEGDPDQPDPQPKPEDRERLSTSNTDQGRWRINGELDLDRGSIVDNALTEARDSLFDPVVYRARDERRCSAREREPAPLGFDGGPVGCTGRAGLDCGAVVGAVGATEHPGAAARRRPLGCPCH